MDPVAQPQPEGNGHGGREAEETPPKPPARARLRRWRREHPVGFAALLLALALVAAAVAVAWWWLHVHESTDDAQIDGHIAALSARVAGTVTAVFVEDNMSVRQGDLLVQLDARDFDVALARAEAELAQARANLAAENPNAAITATTSAAQVAASGDEVATARAAVAAAEAADARAAADLQRYRFLVEARAVPAERYDEIVATAVTRQKAVEEARARLAEAHSRRREAERNQPARASISRAQLAARQAAVQAAEAALARARLDLEYTRVVAPFDGVIGKRSVEPGQHVLAGEQLLAVVALDELWVTANFKETQLRRLAVGQKARVKVDALAVTLDGTIESFAAASGARYSLLPPENATGNYVKVVQRLPVRIHLDDARRARGRLRLGMSVEPRVRIE